MANTGFYHLACTAFLYSNLHLLYLLCIELGLEARIEHGKAGRELSVMAAYDPEERIMASLYLEGSPSDEDQTPEFRRLQPVLEQDLEASHARAQKYKRDASSSLVVVELIAFGLHDSSLVPVVEEQGTSSSLAATVTPLNSLVVTDYLISYVSMVKNVADSELQNISSTHDQQMFGHDDMFDTTLLDKPKDHQVSEPGSS
ncbi:hypothetical protein Tco_1222750 [Tanacetum coccineum]